MQLVELLEFVTDHMDELKKSIDELASRTLYWRNVANGFFQRNITLMNEKMVCFPLVVFQSGIFSRPRADDIQCWQEGKAKNHRRREQGTNLQKQQEIAEVIVADGASQYLRALLSLLPGQTVE